MIHQILQDSTLIYCRKGAVRFNQLYATQGEPEAFNFMILAGKNCPQGQFYELEYSHHCYEKDGNLLPIGPVRHALIQAVNPDTDLTIMLSAAKRTPIFRASQSIYPIQAYLRSDIERVQLVACVKDDTGEPSIIGPYREAIPVSTDAADVGRTPSTVLNAMMRSDNDDPIDFELYTGPDLYTFSAQDSDLTGMDPIFVCGGENVFKPCFAYKRQQDMQEMIDLIEQAIEIANCYNLEYIISMQTYKEQQTHNVISAESYVNACPAFRQAFANAILTPPDGK